MNTFDTSISHGLLLGAEAASRSTTGPDRRRSQWPLGPTPSDERADQAEQICFWLLLIGCAFSLWQGFLF